MTTPCVAERQRTDRQVSGPLMLGDLAHVLVFGALLSTIELHEDNDES